MKRQTKKTTSTENPPTPAPPEPEFGEGTDAKAQKAPEAMDPGAPETSEATPYEVRPRVAYAIQTLIAEVEALFPETTHETSEPDGRNIHKAVLFAAHETPEKFPALMELLTGDPRIQFVVHEEKEQVVYVRTYDNPRTQDSRDPFNLSDAWEELSEQEGGGEQ